MSKWLEIKLGDVIDIKHGYAFNGEGITKETTNNILVTPGNFYIGGGFKADKFKYFDGEYPDNYILKNGDLVVTMTDLSKEGDTLGYAAKIPELNGKIFLHNQRIGLVKFISNDVYPDYLYWLMRTKEYQGFILGSSTGTSIRHTSPKNIKEYRFEIPSLQEQKSIASILSTLDDKIDLLHRQNKTLEALAETLFRQWFVEEINDKFFVGCIFDEFDLTMGLSPPGGSYNEVSDGMPMFQGNADFGFRFPVNRIYTTDPKRVAEKFDTLISVRAPVGEQNMAFEKCCIGRGVAALRYKNNANYYTYTYFKFKSLMKEMKKFNETGTVFGSINKSDFENFKITIPPVALIDKFQNEVKSIDHKVILNCIQIDMLTKIRDILLPKLMSSALSIK